MPRLTISEVLKGNEIVDFIRWYRAEYGLQLPSSKRAQAPVIRAWLAECRRRDIKVVQQIIAARKK